MKWLGLVLSLLAVGCVGNRARQFETRYAIHPGTHTLISGSYSDFDPAFPWPNHGLWKSLTEQECSTNAIVRLEFHPPSRLVAVLEDPGQPVQRRELICRSHGPSLWPKDQWRFRRMLFPLVWGYCVTEIHLGILTEGTLQADFRQYGRMFVGPLPVFSGGPGGHASRHVRITAGGREDP